MNNPSKPESICCQEFDPVPWDNKIFEWRNKNFLKDSVCTFFYMPLTFGKVMKRLDRKVNKANAEIPGWLCLSDHTSRWNMDVYLAVDREIPGGENVALSGQYFSKVYEGPYKDTKKWMEDYKATVNAKGMNIKKLYMWYTTCPKCAKKYGKNYVAIISEVE